MATTGKKQELAERPEMNTKLSYYANQYTGLMERDFSEHGLMFDDYSKQCVMAAMSAIYGLVTSSKSAMENLQGSNLRQVIGQVAGLKLNANAVPRECYFQLRNKQDADGNWHKEVELGIEGDGNDAILRQFGVGVKKVHPVWMVREGDIFTYPRHKGLETTPPEWEERGESQRVVRVVYPVEMNDGRVEYLISERESVKTNLFAHVRNNLMNETFGFVTGKTSKGKDRTRYDATQEEKEKIEAKKKEIYAALKECQTLDEMLSCDAARPYISAAWLDTSESMIVRKMRNNAVKKYPKNFNSIASQSLLQMDETYRQVQEDISENANSVDFEPEVVEGEIVQEEAVEEEPEFMQE